MEKYLKLSPEERAKELMLRFRSIEDIAQNHLIAEYFQAYCALELVKEIFYQLYIHGDNTYRREYWVKVENILKSKIK